ncbi:unnamed protein product [Brachionus calyciflorus]|uniref:Uncharacterized protein n=1 Tax=Brachionus calyciflorus TaxID=104777 RepID=A0A813P2F5_9BILA|nr:unnamed protein product [Brachionus calyciflorus]
MNSQKVQGGGLWNSTRPNISSETQNLLKVMMQESKLTNFQKRTLSNHVKSGTSLPTRVAPSFSIVDKKPEIPKPKRKTVDPREHKNGLRKLEEIVNSGAYEKSDYKPTLRKAITDDDKEKLSKIMAYGKDAAKWPQIKNVPQEEVDYESEPEPDRFDELQDEIKERVEFLETMTKLGKRKEYQAMIMTEISQKIREMELLDKTRIKELEELKRLRNNI